MGDLYLEKASRIYEAIAAEMLDLREKGDIERTLSRLQMVARFASLMPIGRYADGKVENVALKIGKSLHDIVPPESSQESTFTPPLLRPSTRRKVLHVATTVYDVGGHTRLIANWIKNDPQSCHSLVITSQGRYTVPDWLREVVRESGGALVTFPSAGLLVRARWMRDMVQANVDVIMLHHHPSDVLPVVAFATKECPPVAIVNHADHVFWVGCSVADAVISLREAGRILSEKRRFVRSGLLLPIPLANERPIAREVARAQLNVPDDQVVLLSIGSAHKYVPTYTHNFYRAAVKILERNPQAHLYLIGVEWDDEKEYLQQAKHERLHFLGVLKDTVVYESAADLYLEGMPLGSLTALLRAASFSICPVLSFAPTSRVLVSDDVALEDFIGCAMSEEEYIKEIEFLIGNANERARRGKRVRREVVRFHLGEEWKKTLETIYGSLEDKVHEPREIPHAVYMETEDDLSLSTVSRRLNEPQVLWSSMCDVERAIQDIAGLIAPGETLILVDEDSWGTEGCLAGRRCMPFLERDGEYWGSPEDDETAISEVERLRQAGASFIVFASQAFWWLDHYLKFHHYLRSTFRRVLETERVVVFDLRWGAYSCLDNA